MRTTFFMSIFIVLTLLLSACNDSSKVENLMKANAALATELQECQESQKKAAAKKEMDKTEAESFAKYKNFKSNGPNF